MSCLYTRNRRAVCLHEATREVIEITVSVLDLNQGTNSIIAVNS
jgi:hypothetical protein